MLIYYKKKKRHHSSLKLDGHFLRMTKVGAQENRESSQHLLPRTDGAARTHPVPAATQQWGSVPANAGTERSMLYNGCDQM